MAVTKVVMPKLSEVMETGKIIKWLKQEGDRVTGGDAVAEVETDKANVEMEAFGAGILRKILVPEGGQVPVGGLIAVIAEPGDDISALVGEAKPEPAVEATPTQPAPGAQGTRPAADATQEEPAAEAKQTQSTARAKGAESAAEARRTEPGAEPRRAEAAATTAAADGKAPETATGEAPEATAAKAAGRVGGKPSPGVSDRPSAAPPLPKSEDPSVRAPAGPQKKEAAAAELPSNGGATTAPAAKAAAPTQQKGPQPADARPPKDEPMAAQAQPAQPVEAPPRAASAEAEERLKVSPLARKIAAQSGVDLRLLQGSGPGGRIVRRDIEEAMAQRIAPLRPVAARPADQPEYEDLALSPMRAAIARRMPLSKAPVPHFYVTSEIAMDRAWELREALNGLEGQPKISLNDLVVRACALALVQHPGVNASFTGEAIRVYHRAHIGIAVALEEGLITPVLRDCDVKPLTQIAVESRDLAERARARKLRAQEIAGATFSISNLGMFDVADFSAIINPPEGAILAVGAVRTVPVVSDQGLGVGRRMHVTLSCDHRVMDGAMGARFLQDVKRLLEEPLRLLV